jgi:hypothetical protein
VASISSADTYQGVERLPAHRLDDTTLRALCDAGYMGSADYVGIAQARGLHGIDTVAPPAPPAPTEDAGRAFVVSVPSHVGAASLALAVENVGGRIAAAFGHPNKGDLTIPARATRMQHRRPTELPQAMGA